MGLSEWHSRLSLFISPTGLADVGERDADDAGSGISACLGEQRQTLWRPTVAGCSHASTGTPIQPPKSRKTKENRIVTLSLPINQTCPVFCLLASARVPADEARLGGSFGVASLLGIVGFI